MLKHGNSDALIRESGFSRRRTSGYQFPEFWFSEHRYSESRFSGSEPYSTSKQGVSQCCHVVRDAKSIPSYFMSSHKISFPNTVNQEKPISTPSCTQKRELELELTQKSSLFWVTVIICSEWRELTADRRNELERWLPRKTVNTPLCLRRDERILRITAREVNIIPCECLPNGLR